MRTAREIRMLRCGKGYFSQNAIVAALAEKGVHITRQAYHCKEHGKTPFSAREIRALADVLGISAEEAIGYFSSSKEISALLEYGMSANDALGIFC